MFNFGFKALLGLFFIANTSFAEAVQCVSLLNETPRYDFSLYKDSRSVSEKLGLFKEVLDNAVKTNSSDELKQLILLDHQVQHSKVPNWIKFLPEIIETNLIEQSFWNETLFTFHFTKLVTADREDMRADVGAVLRAFALVPKEKMPQSLIDIIEGELGLVNRESAILLNQQEAKRIRVIDENSHFAGTCGQMCLGHGLSFSQVAIEALQSGIEKGIEKSLNRIKSLRNIRGMDSVELGQSILINMEGIGLVGSVKYVGESSMLALKTIIDPEGRVLMSAGNTYRVSRNFFESSIAPLIIDKKKYSKINMSKGEVFELKPLAFGLDVIASRHFNYEGASKEKRLEFLSIFDEATENIERNYDDFVEAVEQASKIDREQH